MKALSNRNHLIDAMKAIAAMGVVLVHFPFPGIFGKVCSSVGVVGVILFFLISGYQSCTGPAQSGKLLLRFRRNLTLTLVAVGVYLLFTVLEQLQKGTLAPWAALWLADPVTYLRMVVLGDFSFLHGDHLWYMPAMLYAYLILYCMEKYRLHRIFYRLLPFLLLLRIAMETYTNSFSHFSWLDWHFSGNVLVGALPIMLLGNYIRSREDRLAAAHRNRWLCFGVISLALVFVTVNVRVFGMDISQPFKIAAAACAFVLSLLIPLKNPVAVLGAAGRRHSLHVYLWHFLIGVLLQSILTAMGAAQWVHSWCLPVAVIAASFGLAHGLTLLPRKAKAA